ncbi:DUF4247 domain-containing protein [Paenibacillus kyungheensis]
MKQRASWLLKIAIMLALLTSLLSGCGNSKVDVNYPLESVSRDGDSTSYVYRAAGETVPVVAEQLSDQRTPQEMSVQDPERMFLVYDNELIQVQQDPEKKEDTLIEVDSDKYVARNYDSSFLQGYLTASIISNLFNSFGGYHYGGSYRGYTTYNTYKPTIQYKKPTAQDIKQAPPLTVNKSGSIFKRGTSSSSKRSKDSGSIFNRGSSSSNGSSGTINRGSRSDSSSGGFFSPSRSSKPKTSSGSGKIRKRGRR